MIFKFNFVLSGGKQLIQFIFYRRHFCSLKMWYAVKYFWGGLCPETPLREFTALPRPLAAFEGEPRCQSVAPSPSIINWWSCDAMLQLWAQTSLKSVALQSPRSSIHLWPQSMRSWRRVWRRWRKSGNRWSTLRIALLPSFIPTFSLMLFDRVRSDFFTYVCICTTRKWHRCD